MSRSELSNFTASQLNHFFPDGHSVEAKFVEGRLGKVWESLEHCFRPLRNKYYRRNGEVYFNHLHGSQYATYLYWLSRHMWEAGDRSVADKVYGLNRALHGCDLYYEVKLPSIFFLDHPLGTVLGRASYDDYLVVLQQCVVGNADGCYPKIGRGAVLLSGVSIIGNCEIGDEVTFGAGALVLNRSISSCQKVVGRANELRTWDSEDPMWKVFFDDEISD